MRVFARLSDVDDGRVRSGMKATVELDAHPDVSYDAVVEDVTPVAQESSRRSLRRSFRVRVALDTKEGPDENLTRVASRKAKGSSSASTLIPRSPSRVPSARLERRCSRERATRPSASFVCTSRSTSRVVLD